ncbi:hypothetical protein LY78DRAFT_187771 [Colletotrichum sublineola]|nr:hypothetical protein LY78DRAFT_187771 [Colletotrichum sublineola]
MYKRTLLPPPRRAPKQHHVTLLHTSPPKPFRVKDGGVGGHFPPFPSSLGHPRPPPSRRPCPPCPSANHHPSAREPSCVCSVSGDFTTCATVEEWFNHWRQVYSDTVSGLETELGHPNAVCRCGRGTRLAGRPGSQISPLSPESSGVNAVSACLGTIGTLSPWSWKGTSFPHSLSCLARLVYEVRDR